MDYELSDPTLTLDMVERTFVLEGGLPRLLAESMDDAMREGETPTDVWGHYTCPLHGTDLRLAVEEAFWVDRRLKLVGRVEETT